MSSFEDVYGLDLHVWIVFKHFFNILLHFFKCCSGSQSEKLPIYNSL